MNQTFQKKVEDLVNRAYLKGFNRSCECSECQREEHLTTEEAVKAILSAIEELVDLEVSDMSYDFSEDYSIGWEDCLKEILDRLKE